MGKVVADITMSLDGFITGAARGSSACTWPRSC
jgi:hypothetical protein